MHHRIYQWTALATVILGPLCSTRAQSTMFNPNPPMSAPYIRPALSPYLNLLRGGDPAANYYLGVLPEYDRRYQTARFSQALQDLSTQVNLIDRALEDPSDLGVSLQKLPPTGHSAGFMFNQGYYNIPNTRPYLPYNPNMSGMNRQTQQQYQR
jgi:hypothetical protein